MSCIIPEQSIYKLMELSVSLSQGMLGATQSLTYVRGSFTTPRTLGHVRCMIVAYRENEH